MVAKKKREMEFRTVIRPLCRQGLVEHGSPMLLLGSCFTDNIGKCLRDDLFDVEVNPFGPVYNPMSVLRSLEILRDCQPIREEELIEVEGLYRSFLFHSRYSAVDSAQAADMMAASVLSGHETLKCASVVFLTLGTTRVFRHLASDRIVANCHKQPAKEFESRCLGFDETVAVLAECIELIRGFNPSARIVFTISPLRYLESGAHGNQLIKSTLLLAVDEVVKVFGEDVASYFPAYEIMMDDLRDYRFYAEDMKHPSSQAVEYIYEIFRASYFSPETEKVAAEARALTRRLSHRIVASSTEAGANEIAARQRAIRAITERYPKLTDAIRRYNDKNTLFK
ncbi:GSCFA domain-containing protein [Duncaniella muris]|uniref:GSCFA domain-containing protein n=1 Tax=Duncaniella muris TaxID=2094150 RepID=UPI00272EC7F5|nr:GSCFA domain-containing protein [Duncaniella muris]